jgi:hypothetical protein
MNNLIVGKEEVLHLNKKKESKNPQDNKKQWLYIMFNILDLWIKHHRWLNKYPILE